VETVLWLRLVDVMAAVAHLQRGAARLDHTRFVLVATVSGSGGACHTNLGTLAAIAATAVVAILLVYTIIT